MSRSEEIGKAFVNVEHAVQDLHYLVARYERENDRFDGAKELAKLLEKNLKAANQHRDDLREDEGEVWALPLIHKWEGRQEVYIYVIDWLRHHYGDMSWDIDF